MLILKPYLLPEICFLSEALIWAAFYRFPVSEIDPDRVDPRFDSDIQEEYEPRVPDHFGYITSEESVRVGLPPNPEWDALFNDDGRTETYFDDKMIAELLASDKLSEADKDKLRLDVEYTKELSIKQDAWDEKYEEYIEVIEAKLFLALKTGQIKAQGRPYPEEEKNSWSPNEYEHEEIPASFWRQGKIDWNTSSSATDAGHYFHIIVPVDELFAQFPAPDPTQAKDVEVIADQYVLKDDAPVSLLKGKRGRKPYDWTSFNVEMAARVAANTLPAKQDACIEDMKIWCKKHWGQEPGRSTLLEKISPYYDRFKR